MPAPSDELRAQGLTDAIVANLRAINEDENDLDELEAQAGRIAGRWLLPDPLTMVG